MIIEFVCFKRGRQSEATRERQTVRGNQREVGSQRRPERGRRSEATRERQTVREIETE